MGPSWNPFFGSCLGPIWGPFGAILGPYHSTSHITITIISHHKKGDVPHQKVLGPIFLEAPLPDPHLVSLRLHNVRLRPPNLLAHTAQEPTCPKQAQGHICITTTMVWGHWACLGPKGPGPIWGPEIWRPKANILEAEGRLNRGLGEERQEFLLV